MELDDSNSAPVDDTVQRTKKEAGEYLVHYMIQPPGWLVAEHPAIQRITY